jgi:acyl-CoA synthetase (AMP-forming)/AMP-acid ligase II
MALRLSASKTNRARRVAIHAAHTIDRRGLVSASFESVFAAGVGFKLKYRRRACDDLVKISGQWVYPLEVDLWLANHAMVRECTMLAAEGADRLTLLKAFVVLSNGVRGSEDTTQQLQDYVKGRLLPYNYPRFVIYLDDLPKTGSGKIDRQSLLKHHLPQT